MSDGHCQNPIHGNFCPSFREYETHCSVCGGPKWKWASWSEARRRIPVLVSYIAGVERGRAESRKLANRVVMVVDGIVVEHRFLSVEDAEVYSKRAIDSGLVEETGRTHGRVRVTFLPDVREDEAAAADKAWCLKLVKMEEEL